MDRVRSRRAAADVRQHAESREPEELSERAEETVARTTEPRTLDAERRATTSANPEVELDGTVGLRMWTPLSGGQPSGPHFLADLEASYVFHGGPVDGHGFALGGAALFGDVVTVHGGFTAALVGTQVGDGQFGVGVRAGLRARALAGFLVAELTYELRAYEPMGAGLGGEVHMVRLMFGTELLSLLLLLALRPPSFHFPI